MDLYMHLHEFFMTMCRHCCLSSLRSISLSPASGWGMFSRTLPDDTLELHTLHQLFAVSNLEEANINTTISLKKLTCAHKGYGNSTVAVADGTKVGDIW